LWELRRIVMAQMRPQSGDGDVFGATNRRGGPGFSPAKQARKAAQSIRAVDKFSWGPFVDKRRDPRH
jgi:hypothetical protein